MRKKKFNFIHERKFAIFALKFEQNNCSGTSNRKPRGGKSPHFKAIGCRVQGSTAHALLHRVLCTVPCTAHAVLHCVPCTVPHTLSYTLYPTPCTAPFSIPCSVLHLALCPVQHAVQSTLNSTGTVQYSTCAPSLLRCTRSAIRASASAAATTRRVSLDRSSIDTRARSRNACRLRGVRDRPFRWRAWRCACTAIRGRRGVCPLH